MAAINANELLSVIARSEGMTAGELAFMWNVSVPQMQAAIDKLYRGGQIAREVQGERSEGITTWLVCWRAA